MADNSYHSQAGVYIYDTFIYPDNDKMFMTVIYAEIDPLQYWRDRPLLISRATPITAQAVNMTSIELAELTGNETVQDSIEEVVELAPVIEEQQKEAQEVLDELKAFQFPDPNIDEYYQYEWTATQGQVEFFEKYSQEYVIVSVDGITLNFNEYTADNNTSIILTTGANAGQIVQLSSMGRQPEVTSLSGNITSVSSVSSIDSVDEVPVESSPGINLVSDDIIRRVAIQGTPDEYTQLWEDYFATYDPVIDQFQSIVDAIEPEYQSNSEFMQAREKAATESWKPLGELSDQWYGIPLINIGPKDTPTSESFIIEVSSKNDWNVKVSNVITTGLERDTLTINKQIPPGVKFMLGFYVIENKYGIILRIEDDPKVYQKELSTFNKENLPQAISYGVDNDFIKSLNGHIWDVLFWEQPSNFNHNVPSPEPDYPKDGWIYDFRKSGVNSDIVGGTVDGNTVRSIYDYGPSARVGSGPNSSDGQFIHLVPNQENIATGFPGIHPWYFIFDTYMDSFFCRTHLKHDSFTLNWFQWLPKYPTGIHNWVSDSIFSNYLSYDYTNFRIIMEFNGRRYQETLTLPEELWAGFSLRYNKTTGELVFSFMDTKYMVIEKVIINIGIDLEFELISLFGRYDKVEKEYVEAHRGLMGMVMIYEEYRSDQEVMEICAEVGKYLKQYEPTYKQILLLEGA